jgi:hypothetical protein
MNEEPLARMSLKIIGLLRNIRRIYSANFNQQGQGPWPFSPAPLGPLRNPLRYWCGRMGEVSVPLIPSTDVM